MIQPLKQQHRDNYLFSWIDGQTPRAPDLVETRHNGFAPVSVPRHALLKSLYSCLANSSVNNSKTAKRITTEEAVVAEATRSINDQQNGSNPVGFIIIFWKNQNLFLPCCFIVIVAFTGINFWNATVFFSLEKKRNNVQDSDNSDVYIIVLILTLTHTPEEARSANVVSTEGEMFIVAVTECFLSIVYGWRYYLCAEGIIYVSYSYVHTSTFVLDLAGLLCILRTFSPNRAAGVAFLPRVRAGLCTVHTWSSMYNTLSMYPCYVSYSHSF